MKIRASAGFFLTHVLVNVLILVSAVTLGFSLLMSRSIAVHRVVAGQEAQWVYAAARAKVEACLNGVTLPANCDEAAAATCLNGVRTTPIGGRTVGVSLAQPTTPGLCRVQISVSDVPN